MVRYILLVLSGMLICGVAAPGNAPDFSEEGGIPAAFESIAEVEAVVAKGTTLSLHRVRKDDFEVIGISGEEPTGGFMGSLRLYKKTNRFWYAFLDVWEMREPVRLEASPEELIVVGSKSTCVLIRIPWNSILPPNAEPESSQ